MQQPPRGTVACSATRWKACCCRTHGPSFVVSLVAFLVAFVAAPSATFFSLLIQRLAATNKELMKRQTLPKCMRRHLCAAFPDAFFGPFSPSDAVWRMLSGKGQSLLRPTTWYSRSRHSARHEITKHRNIPPRSLAPSPTGLRTRNSGTEVVVPFCLG